VVIPTYQRKDLVLDAVRALVAQEELPLEVVVVVDGSTDGTADALRRIHTPFPLVVVEQPNRGLAQARNRGAEVARGDFLLFLDDDMLAAADLLVRVREAHDRGADAVTGHIPTAPGTEMFRLPGAVDWAERRRERLLATQAAPAVGDVLGGQLSVRREAFQALGGFDDRRFTIGGSYGGEDGDFARRLMTGGHRVVFAPDAVSHQVNVVTPRAYLRNWHQAGASDAVFLRKHPSERGEIERSKRPDERWNRRVIRPLARVPGFRSAVAAVASPLAAVLAVRHPEDPRAARAFFKVRNLEYWRGMEMAGGFPEVRPFRILCYHAVGDLAGTRLDEYGVPAADLRRQLRLLRQVGYRFITLEGALRAVRGEPGVSRRGVLVTFDDCYSDLLHDGLPLLQELGVPAAAYAVAGRVGGTNTWDVAIGATELALLDAPGLRELQRAGIEVGAHGMTHQPLTRASGQPDVLAEETMGAAEALRARGLEPIRTFAYPHGEHDGASRSAVADAGMEAAFTVTPGIARPGADPYQLPRIEILRQDGSGIRFLLKVWSAGRLQLPAPRWVVGSARRRVGRLRRRHRRQGRPAQSSRRSIGGERTRELADDSVPQGGAGTASWSPHYSGT
jgi:glycosyltransferase involved in cell wall biosynthesis/peptidoglycan/xylan/chitin deacetylase (PgdA/CDA1 family)